MPKQFPLTFTSAELMALHELVLYGQLTVTRPCVCISNSTSSQLLAILREKIEGTDNLDMETPLLIGVASEELAGETQLPELDEQKRLWAKYAQDNKRAARKVTDEYT